MNTETLTAHIQDIIPKPALKLQQSLEQAGFEAYLVGGFIRDAILGRAASDIDITTNALWQQVKNVASKAGFKTYETGIKHGTITIVDPGTSLAIEVTTYRVDGAYKDSRHPDSVEFVSSLTKDLERRDFTINAIAYSPSSGIKDPLGGINDIDNRLIKVVGDGKKRFSEDGLRILRAARFASQLGFTIDPDTYSAMLENKHVLSNVSTERITHELDCLLLGDHVYSALMNTVDVLNFVLPELTAMKGCDQLTKYHIYDVFEHTAHVVQNTQPTRLARWTALCHDMGKPASAFFDQDGVEHFYGHAHISVHIAKGMLKRLLMSNAFIDDVCKLVRFHDSVITPSKKSVKRMLQNLDGRQDLMRTLLDIKRADALGQAPMCFPRVQVIDEVENILDRLLEDDEAFAIKDLNINGNEVIQMGIDQGPVIGDILSDILNKVIEEELKNEKDELLDYIKREYL